MKRQCICSAIYAGAIHESAMQIQCTRSANAVQERPDSNAERACYQQKTRSSPQRAFRPNLPDSADSRDALYGKDTKDSDGGYR
jgi:hypothetical protein